MKKEYGYVTELREWLTLRNYAASTVNGYSSSLRQFLIWHKAQEMGPEIDASHVRRYLLHRYDQGRSWQTINCDYSVLQQFFTNILKREWDVDNLPRARGERSLPPILSNEEVGQLINAARGLKHQAFIALLYGTGLRLSEALALRITHVDGKRKQVRVIKGKGGKDRYVNLPECLLPILREYYLEYRPVDYLFNGQTQGTKWSPRAAQYAIEMARSDAGIAREVHPHLLRHCYATHHLEGGTNLVYLKEQLGHKNLKTTARYIRLCVEYPRQVPHPLARLQLAGPSAT
jgi:site-specific recombinase XerD